MFSRTLVLGGLLAVWSLGLAFADEIEPQKQCEALSDAFDNYSAKKTDPDMDKAVALSKEGEGRLQ